jgi:glycosyltransferase involved in cell wall biosynthesis
MNDTPFLSVVIPMYNESESLDILFNTLVPALDALGERWEVVCVDDGSRDDTFDQVAHFHQQDSRIRIIGLSRNFGKEAALTAGLLYTSGQVVVPIDADLQDPPSLIGEMIAKWREGYKVVLATRKTRDGDELFKRVSANMFYKLLSKMTSVKIPQNTGDFRLMDRQVIEAIRELPERTRFMKGIFAWVGFSTTQIFYDRPERAAGEAKQNFRRLWSLAMDGIFSFTTLPLRIWTYLGSLISSFAFSYGVYLIVRTLTQGVDVPGYASIMVAVLFMGGIQLISLGVIGEYVGRIYRESKRRPLFLVAQTVGFGEGK